MAHAGTRNFNFEFSSDAPLVQSKHSGTAAWRRWVALVMARLAADTPPSAVARAFAHGYGATVVPSYP